MIGIYKITNPKGRVYIGQSINIERRFKEYKNNLAKGQLLLNRSFLKYGIYRHIFEIILECEKENLNNLERYFQILFNCVKNGLNCILTNEKIFESKTELKRRNDIINIIDSII